MNSKPTVRFIDVTRKNNLYYPDSKCMGLTVFDYDDDGNLDIFQANDHQLNFLFRNDNGIYKEVGVAKRSGSKQPWRRNRFNACITWDIDGDGLIDILVSDLDYGALYKNLGNGFFKDITEESGVAAAMAGKGSWGAHFLITITTGTSI